MFPDTLIIDFDSTFITGESLDELSKIVLKNYPDSAKHLNQIHELTRAGMEGKMPFDDIAEVTQLLSEKITPSFKRNKKFIFDHAENILIISGGFREMIIPIVADYGIAPEHVFANEFIYDVNNCITEVNQENVMAQEGGKVSQAKALRLYGEIHVIGDGFTDYQLKAEGPATKFYAFVENVRRENICKLADGILSNFDDFIKIVLD